MYPPSHLCRAQEKIQLDRASGSALDNVRSIATKAAQAWRVQALFAEKRELDQARRLAVGDGAPGLSPTGPDFEDEEDDRWLSENPDRIPLTADAGL